MAMNTVAKAGTIIRFECNGKPLIGYVVSTEGDMMRVCTKPGTYYWVDRCLSDAI